MTPLLAKERVKNAHDEVKVEAHSRFEVEKALGALKEEQKKLDNKLTVVERERSSALASLKNVEAQVEDQRKLLNTMELELATQKQLVMDLKAELQKVKDAAKEATQVAKEATEAAKRAFYEHKVEDTEKRLAEEVAGVCKDYYTETWIEVLNSAGVPADSELRKAESIFLPEHIREAPMDLPSTALPLLPPE